MYKDTMWILYYVEFLLIFQWLYFGLKDFFTFCALKKTNN